MAQFSGAPDLRWMSESLHERQSLRWIPLDFADLGNLDCPAVLGLDGESADRYQGKAKTVTGVKTVC